MGDPNIYVSNGTCYSAAGKKLDGSFIPCGNDAFGHKACCGAGDNCLADNSCWGQHGSGYGSSLTYMAGCSDPDYKDASCPDKKIDQPWIALTHCDRSNGAWAVCSQQGDPTTLQPGSYCSCTNAASSTLAFSDTETLTSICSLPKATGQSIQWFAGFIPTAPPPPATTGPGGPSSGSNGGSPTASNTRSSASNSNNGNTSSRTSGAASPSETGSSPSDPNGSGNGATVLDQGAKIGIGIGVALGILLVLGLIAFLLLRLRRRRREARKSYEVESSAFNEPKPKTSMAEANRLSTAPTVAEADSRPVSEADGTPARPWSMRSELEGDRPEGPVVKGATPAVPVRSAKELSPVAELPGSEPAPEARRAP